MYGAMSEIPVIIFRLSVSVLAFAAKGNLDGIVQQQIETMGLRQWLSFVSAWVVERAYTEAAIFAISVRQCFSEASRNSGTKNTILSPLDLHRERAATRRQKRLHSMCVLLSEIALMKSNLIF